MTNMFSELSPTQTMWLIIGFFGQALFFMRFFVQWIESEKRGESVIPVSFWYFSIGGGLVLLAYSIYRQDPVFILGQAAGVLIYSRNLFFIHRSRSKADTAS
jgi:lipid-A-disaccharide synthase-like uncharacterized protein